MVIGSRHSACPEVQGSVDCEHSSAICLLGMVACCKGVSPNSRTDFSVGMIIWLSN